METCLLFPTAASPTSKSLNRWSYGSACLAAMVKRENDASAQPRCTTSRRKTRQAASSKKAGPVPTASSSPSSSSYFPSRPLAYSKFSGLRSSSCCLAMCKIRNIPVALRPRFPNSSNAAQLGTPRAWLESAVGVPYYI